MIKVRHKNFTVCAEVLNYYTSTLTKSVYTYKLKLSRALTQLRLKLSSELNGLVIQDLYLQRDVILVSLLQTFLS